MSLLVMRSHPPSLTSESLALIRALSEPEDPLLVYGRARLSTLVDSAMAVARPEDEEACIEAFKASWVWRIPRPQALIVTCLADRIHRLLAALRSGAFSECSAGPEQWTLLKGHFDPGNETWDITREEVNATSYVDRYAGRES